MQIHCRLHLLKACYPFPQLPQQVANEWSCKNSHTLPYHGQCDRIPKEKGVPETAAPRAWG